MQPNTYSKKQRTRRLDTLRHLHTSARQRVTDRRRDECRTVVTVSVAWVAATVLILLVPIASREFWLIAATAGTIGALLALAGARRRLMAQHAADTHDAVAAIRYELAMLEIQFHEQSTPGFTRNDLADLQNQIRALRASRDARLNDTAESHWQHSPYRLLAYLLVALLLLAVLARILEPTDRRSNPASDRTVANARTAEPFDHAPRPAERTPAAIIPHRPAQRIRGATSE